MKESKRTENLLNKNNECLFISHLYTLTFTVKGFKVTYNCTQASNMESTVNKDCDHCILGASNTFFNR